MNFFIDGELVTGLKNDFIEWLLEKKKVIGLDVDKTIAGFNSDELYPAFEYWLREEWKGQTLFLITNQGGPACHDANWGEQYPTLESVTARLQKLQKAISTTQPKITTVYLHVCWGFKTKKGEWIFPKGIETEGLDWDWWRKPGPGMIEQALLVTGVDKKDFVYIGDYHDLEKNKADDLEAAMAAGVDFVPAQMWLNPIMYQLEIAEAELGSNPNIAPNDH